MCFPVSFTRFLKHYFVENLQKAASVTSLDRKSFLKSIYKTSEAYL